MNPHLYIGPPSPISQLELWITLDIFNFIWRGSENQSAYPWIAWKRLTLPKEMEGWGINISHIFARSLTTKGVWMILEGRELWVKVARKQ